MTAATEKPQTTSNTSGYRSWNSDERKAILSETAKASADTLGGVIMLIGLFVYIIMVLGMRLGNGPHEDLSLTQFAASTAVGMAIMTGGGIVWGLSNNARELQHKLMEETGTVYTFDDLVRQLQAEKLMHRYHRAVCPGKQRGDVQEKLLAARHDGFHAIEQCDAVAYSKALESLDAVAADKETPGRPWL